MSVRRLIAAWLAVATVGGTAVGVSADDRSASAGTTDLADVKRATARYHDESRARRDGYAPDGPCIGLPGVGGMGVHYVNAQLAADGEIDPLRPEMLLYEPQRDGRLRLVGVEWLVADADGDLGTDDDRPSVLGRPFDGPMPGHGPAMPIHYDLHAYLWRHNPDGVFAVQNPRVRCP